MYPRPELSDIPMGSFWDYEVLLDEATGTVFSALGRATYWPDQSLYGYDTFPEWTIPLLVDALARQFDGDVELREVNAPGWYAEQVHNPDLAPRVVHAYVPGDAFVLSLRMRGRWATIPGEGGRASWRVLVIEADVADGTHDTIVIPQEEMNQVAAVAALWAVKMVRPS